MLRYEICIQRFVLHTVSSGETPQPAATTADPSTYTVARSVEPTLLSLATSSTRRKAKVLPAQSSHAVIHVETVLPTKGTLCRPSGNMLARATPLVALQVYQLNGSNGVRQQSSDTHTSNAKSPVMLFLTRKVLQLLMLRRCSQQAFRGNNVHLTLRCPQDVRIPRLPINNWSTPTRRGSAVQRKFCRPC